LFTFFKVSLIFGDIAGSHGGEYEGVFWAELNHVSEFFIASITRAMNKPHNQLTENLRAKLLFFKFYMTHD
jgi:hypothetical protein